MQYSNLTRNSKFFIKRFSHQNRYQKAIELCNLKSNESLLDFGTGDAYFLHLLKDFNVRLTGYEPVASIYNQIQKSKAFDIVKQLYGLKNSSFDVVTCLEVLEHFETEKQLELIASMRDKLKNSGRIIISVPLEVGLSSLFKNLFRILYKQKEKDTSFTNMFKALFFIKTSRSKKEDYISSHIGFNYKLLERELKQQFYVQKKVFSPFPFFKSMFNSQVFFVLIPKENVN